MINKWLTKIDQSNTNNLILYLVAISITLAAWMQYIQHGWINPDSVLYFEQARLFSLGKWRQALEVFNWPLYGACIAFVNNLTTLGIQQSAQLLSIVFFGVATFAFLYIIKQAGGDNRTIFLGSILLFSSQYIVGDALEMLLRDQGFWAFFLSAIFFFIRYCHTYKRADLLLWQICMVIATLFRIEAILYLLLLPVICFSLTSGTTLKQRTLEIVNAYSLTILASIIITAILVLQPDSTMSQFGRLAEVFTTDLFQELTEKFADRTDVMANQVLGRYLDDYATQGLLLTFAYIIISKTISTTGLIATTLSALSIKNRPQTIAQTSSKILLVVATIALVSATLIITKVFVLSGRYVVALTWILLIFASFYLCSLSRSNDKKRRIAFTVLCIIFILGITKNILPKREGYNYRQDAVAWAASNSKNSSSIFYDDSRMVYYADAPFTGKWNDNWKKTLSAIEAGSIQNYELLLISHSKKRPNRLKIIQQKLPKYVETKRFYNAKKKKFVAIYARK